MLSAWLGVFLFVSTEVMCKGNTCQFDVKLKAIDVVHAGSTVKFSCSIPQCVTDDYPDINFRMSHNGTEFGEMRKTEENAKGFSIAYFEKEFTSSSDAGMYACSALISGLDKVTTNISVIFIYDEIAHQFIWANAPLKPPDVDRVILIVTVGTVGAVVVVVIILVIVRKLMCCCQERSDDPEKRANEKDATTEMEPFISNDKETDDVQKTNKEQHGANRGEAKRQEKKSPVCNVFETKTVDERQNVPVPSLRKKKLHDKSTKDKTIMERNMKTKKEQTKGPAASGRGKNIEDAPVNGMITQERPTMPEEKKKFPVAGKRKDKPNREKGPEHDPLTCTTEEQEAGLSPNLPNEDNGFLQNPRGYDDMGYRNGLSPDGAKANDEQNTTSCTLEMP